MPCESCHVQFTIFKHKKSCFECRRLFCLNCLEKTRKRSLCSRCVIFSKRPLSRTELQRLKAKDLIVYLQSKHIPTAGCVEKDDLVNLVLAHVDSIASGASPSSNSSSSIPSPGSQFENIRSYFTNLTPPQSQQASSPPPQHPNFRTNAPRRPPPPERQSSRETFASSGENAFNLLRQGCQVFLENVTDKLATNFKFDASQASPSPRNSSSPSSATSPSTSSQPPPPPPHPQRMQNQNISQRSTGSEGVARPPPPLQSRPKPRVPLDTLRVSESGCECSDDEESKAQRTLSQSTSNLLDDPQHDDPRLMAVPGTSGCPPGRSDPPRVPISRSKASTLSDSSEFSSFEELNVVTVESKVKKADNITPATSDHVVQLEATTSRRDLPDCGLSSGHVRLISRRRSDGCLNSRVGEVAIDTKVEQQRKCCSRCGRRKNELNRRLKRFHDQLTALSTEDVEVRQHLEALLSYLERKRVSVLSNGESNGEESASEAPVIVNQPMPRQEAHVPPPPVIPQEDGQPLQPTPEKVIYKRRFVQLDEIKSSTDLEEFSVKQLKEILVLNRVDFKGCCEKKELIERVRRLLDDYHACPAVDKLPSDDLCKICMDAPIECVILECGHMATCTSCGKVLSECPICRQFIIRVVRFFRA